MKRYVCGDIHGEYEKLKTLLKKVNFDYNNDELISLGDVVDRGKDSYLCVEELLKIKNLIAIKGNHDVCFYDSIKTGNQNLLFNQGGRETLESYIKHCNPEKEIVNKMSGYVTDFEYDDYPTSHVSFFKNQLNYYIDSENRLFIHAGYDRNYLIEDLDNQDISDFYWDRDFINQAMSCKNIQKLKTVNNFKEVFIGHTPTICWNIPTPINCRQIVWNVDTGSGKGGLLTIMNIETKEFFQA